MLKLKKGVKFSSYGESQVAPQYTSRWQSAIIFATSLHVVLPILSIYLARKAPAILLKIALFAAPISC